MSLDILFLDPPLAKNTNSVRHNGAMLYLASYLAGEGFDIKVSHLVGDYQERLPELMELYKPKNVAIACKWYDTLYAMTDTARLVKEISPETSVITGGPTATFFHKELVEQGMVDMVVRGEAEEPLIRYLKGEELTDCTLAKNGAPVMAPLSPTRRDKERLGFNLKPLDELCHNAGPLINNELFVLTGLGCAFNCFYCGASASAQRALYGSASILFRPVEAVAQDLWTLRKFTRSLVFDFGTEASNGYYHRLLKMDLPPNMYSYFAAWQLPDEELVDMLSDKFERCIILLDTSHLSERLRIDLAKKRMVKPFFDNASIERLIKYVDTKPNLKIELDNITGFPGETQEDHEIMVETTRRYLDMSDSIVNIALTPLSIEPGSGIHMNPEAYDYVLYRKTFEDFYELTKTTFTNDLYYQFDTYFNEGPEIREKLKDFHPYGGHRRGETEEDNFRRFEGFVTQFVDRYALNARTWPSPTKSEN